MLLLLLLCCCISQLVSGGHGFCRYCRYHYHFHDHFHYYLPLLLLLLLLLLSLLVSGGHGFCTSAPVFRLFASQQRNEQQCHIGDVPARNPGRDGHGTEGFVWGWGRYATAISRQILVWNLGGEGHTT